MINSLVIQRLSQGILLSGNSKSKLIDIDIPVYIKSDNGLAVQDLATKETCFVQMENVSVSEMHDFILKHDNDNYYMPNPASLPLLPEYRYLMNKVPQTRPLRILTLDIEVASTRNNIFDPIHNPIISIGIKRNNEETVVLHYYDKLVQDRTILEIFRREYLDFDPDIIMVYNAHFDIPYILARMSYHKIPIDLGRSYKSNTRKLIPRIWNKSTPDRILSLCTDRNMPIMRDLIPGRIIYDVYVDVSKDQSLTGKVKNRRLKTIAQYFGFGGFLLDEDDYSNMQSLIGTDRLIEYNKSDVDITYDIGTQIYIPVHEKKAEIMDIPIGCIINSAPSYIPNIYSMRNLHAINMYPFDKNNERYSRYSQLDYRETNDVSLDNDNDSMLDIIELTGNESDIAPTKFEAAIVYQSEENIGYFDKVWKVDFSGYYPSAIMSLNLGPETTKMVEFRNYDKDGFSVNRNNDIIRMVVPDKRFNRNIVIDIDQSQQSFFKKILIEFKNARAGTKKKVKELELSNGNKEEINALNAYQLAIKVLMNTFFGASGAQFAQYGDLATAIGIVGFCREATRFACNNIIKYSNIIEIDTDGMYVKEDIDVDYLNTEIAKHIKELYGCDSYLTMDKDEFGRGIFLKMKNYVLEDLNGKVKFTGSSLKGSNKPNMFDKSKEKIANIILQNNKDTDYFDLVSQLMDLRNYKWPDDFIITVKAKPLNSYATTSFMYKLVTICKQYIELEGQVTIEYVHTAKGIKPIQSLNKDDVYDYDKYSTVIKNLLKVFHLDKYTTMQMDLFS